MGQAKNRGTREQRVAQAVSRWREGPNLGGTVTGRFSGKETHFKEVDKTPEPRTEIVSPVIEADYAKIEERVMAGGKLTEQDYRLLYGGSPGGGMRILHTGLRGRGTLALAALAASALAAMNGSVILIDERSPMKRFDDGKQD